MDAKRKDAAKKAEDLRKENAELKRKLREASRPAADAADGTTDADDMDIAEPDDEGRLETLKKLRQVSREGGFAETDPDIVR